MSEEQLAELREIFDHYDTDKNGVIDRNELRALLGALDPEFSERDVKQAIEALDDNANGVIDWEEFVEWWGARYSGHRFRASR